MTGTVVISLDFELGWGHREVRPDYVEKLRRREPEIDRRIGELIEIFENHDIAGTWGVVGRLLEDGEDSLFHNPALVEKVVDSDVDHEVGLHSYAHRPFDGLTREQAREDVTKGLAALSRFDVGSTTFIFPQNKIEYADILSEHGFQCYRTGDNGWMTDFITNIVPSMANPEVDASGLVSVPGSLFIASPSYPIRILQLQAGIGIRRAIRNDGIVHFWLHPHNVIIRSGILNLLNRIFSKIDRCRSQDELDVATMNSIAESVPSRS